jgi:hypothetical protein
MQRTGCHPLKSTIRKMFNQKELTTILTDRLEFPVDERSLSRYLNAVTSMPEDVLKEIEKIIEERNVP